MLNNKFLVNAWGPSAENDTGYFNISAETFVRLVKLGLDTNELSVLFALNSTRHVNKGELETWPSTKTVADITSLSVEDTRNAITSIVDKGLLSARKDGHLTKYSFKPLLDSLVTGLVPNAPDQNAWKADSAIAASIDALGWNDPQPQADEQRPTEPCLCCDNDCHVSDLGGAILRDLVSGKATLCGTHSIALDKRVGKAPARIAF
jgi:hypothetical protein